MIPRYPQDGSLLRMTCSCPMSARRSNRCIDPSGGCIQLARNDHSLNLRRSLVNLSCLRVAEQPLDGIILHISIAAEYLDRLRGHPHRCFAGEQLAHRAELRDRLAAIPRSSCRVEKRSSSGHSHGHISKLELDGLILLDRFAELTALRGVASGM